MRRYEQAWRFHKQQEGAPVCKKQEFSFVQNFIYNLFDKVGICGLLKFVMITGLRIWGAICLENPKIEI